MSSLPKDTDIAALTNGIYAYAGYPPVTWDYLHLANGMSGISFGIKQVEDAVAVICRGSVTAPDWIHDLDTFADPFEHSELGPVHPGFYDGVPDAWSLIKQRIKPTNKVIVSGHSLGAAHAVILTGVMVADKMPPARRVCFGEPRAGFQQLADLISVVPAASYRNWQSPIHHDFITDVPFNIGDEAYVHPCPLTDICQPPTLNWIEKFGVFAFHAMPLYLEAVSQLSV